MADGGDVCAEFAKNFATLQVKFEEMKVRYGDSQQRVRELQHRVENLTREVESRDEIIAGLKAERAELMVYRDRSTKATVAVEHMRGRLESQHKAAEDRELEHRHEIEQLRAQLNDALTRIARNGDHTAIMAVSTQKVEIEERCALVSSQLIMEKERAAQTQMAAIATVRDLASRNLELEQRLRALDSEVSMLRSKAQRATDQATEASLERERCAAENGSLHTKVNALQRDLASAHADRDDRERVLMNRLAEEKAEAERSRDEVLRQLADANQRISDLVTQRALDADRIAANQRAALAKLEAARNELEQDLEVATNARHQSIEENQRLKGRISQERAEGEELRAQLRSSESRVHALQQTVNSLQSRLEAAAQTEAWLATERDRVAAIADRNQKRCEELVAAQGAVEARLLDAERVALQLDDAKREIADMAAARERDASAVRQLEAQYAHKVDAVKAEAKALKRRYTQVLQKEERQKKVLLQALLEKEQASVMSPLMTTSPHAFSAAAARSGASGAPVDTIALLREQSERARRFREEISHLDGTALPAGP
jgi:chromosome segregation ATPase